MRYPGTLKICALLACTLALSGCDLFEDADEAAIPGERISILTFEKTIEADPRMQNVTVRLPRPYVNEEWTQPGGFSDSAMHHLALGASPEILWTTSQGQGSYEEARIVAVPIVANNRLFFLDAIGNVSAMDAETGQKLWYKELTPEDEDEDAGFGGGVAFSDGLVIAANGFGFVVALDPATGEEKWRHTVGIPFRAAPVADGGRIFVTTHDNQLYVLAADDGRVLWTHQGIVESAGILGSSAASVSGETVIVPYTSGELFAMRVQNGRTSWSDALSRTGRTTPLSQISDIAGRVVIDRGLVFAVSHAGRMVAINLRTGERLWTRTIASVQTPWIAGEFLYMVTSEAEVVCLSRTDGRVRWITPLERYDDPEDREGPIEWSGPVLAGDRLILVSSQGKAIAVSPYDGRKISEFDLPGSSFVSPIVANETVYFLTDDAEVVALR